MRLPRWSRKLVVGVGDAGRGGRCGAKWFDRLAAAAGVTPGALLAVVFIVCGALVLRFVVLGVESYIVRRVMFPRDEG